MELAVTVPGQTDSSQKLSVADAIFDREFNETLIHQVVIAYQANARQGTKAQKTRSEVRGGGKKPWRQKGTGRARAGTIRSPIWRTGGVTFAAKPRSHAQKVNKKAFKVALQSIFSELIRQERLVVVDEFSLAEAKTKQLVTKLTELNLTNVLIIADSFDSNLYLAARNLPHVDVQEVTTVAPTSLIHHEKVLITSAGLKLLEEKLG